MAKCNCKVSTCSKCPSLCKRCGFACDRVDPEVARARKRGRQKQTGSARKAKKKAKTRVHASIVEEKKAEGCPCPKCGSGNGSYNRDSWIQTHLTTIQDVWEAFGFSKWRKKKLPSKETGTNNPNLAREAEENATKSGSTLVQSVMAAAERVALIL
mmetsp:Transcript_2001/g.3220  ORF Transcript_2001/g.3220 Transcript_2001/m.3220 type:complete len:156 (-) Transcript_2001:2931-3398(-)